MLFNPIITYFVKTSHLFHVIIIELKRQKHIYSILLPESKKILSSKITLNRQRHKGAWLNRIQKEVEKVWPPPLSLRTVLVVYLSVPFLLKSSYTLLRMLKCLKLYAWNCMWGQDTPDFMEISSYPCNCIIFIIKVINYALWHTFESKRYMYFHNKTWYTCTHCYM